MFGLVAAGLQHQNFVIVLHLITYDHLLSPGATFNFTQLCSFESIISCIGTHQAHRIYS